MCTRLLTTLLGCSAAVLIAACGGSSPNGGSSSSAAAGNGPSFKQMTADAYKHSDCMRSHGIKNFPDPKIINQPGHQGIGISLQGINPNSPAFKAAQQACAHLMPGGGGPNHQVGNSSADQRRHTQALLALARCVRGKGFPRFPDPNSQGDITPQMFTAAGIDIHQPAFVAAAESCASVTHGVITVADIKRALAAGSHQTQRVPTTSSATSGG